MLIWTLDDIGKPAREMGIPVNIWMDMRDRSGLEHYWQFLWCTEHKASYEPLCGNRVCINSKRRLDILVAKVVVRNQRCPRCEELAVEYGIPLENDYSV